MSLFDVITDSFEILKNDPKIVLPNLVTIAVGIVFGIIIVVAVLSSFIGSVPQGPYGKANGSALNATIKNNPTKFMSLLVNSFASILPIIIVFIAIAYVIRIFIGGMYVSIAVQGFSGGISLNDAFSLVAGRFWSLLGINLIYSAVKLIIIGILAVLLFGSSISTFQTLIQAIGKTNSTITASPALPTFLASLILKLLAFVITAMIVIAILSIFFYVGLVMVITEKLGALDALRKSIDIGKTRFLGIFALFVLVFLITLAYLAVNWIINLLPFVGWLIGLVITIFFGTWMGLVPTVFYLELIRKKKPRFNK